MKNPIDIDNLSKQIYELRTKIDKSQEHLFAIEMLLVDNNNSQLKDGRFTNDLEELDKSFESLLENIQALESKLYIK